MGSRDRRNDRFDRSWISARCLVVVPFFVPVPFQPSPYPSSLSTPFSFLFFLYIDVRIPCRLFLSARMGLYDVPSHRAPCRANSSVLFSLSFFVSKIVVPLASTAVLVCRILYRQNHRTVPPQKLDHPLLLFVLLHLLRLRPRELTSSTAKLLAELPNFC